MEFPVIHSCLVLTPPSFIKILLNVLTHDLRFSYFQRVSVVKVLKRSVESSCASVCLAFSVYYLQRALEEMIAVQSSGIYHQLIGIHSCFLPSSPSTLALCCVKIPSDRKQVETNYNAQRTLFSIQTQRVHLTFSIPCSINFKVKVKPFQYFNQTWTLPEAL